MLAVWKLVVLLNICNVFHVIAVTQFPPVPFQPNLAALFFKSQLTLNAQQATLCFTQYAQNSNSVNEKYSAEYSECLVNTKTKRDALDQEMLEKHTELVASTEAVCHRMTVCNEMESTLDQFQCHSNAGPLNSKNLYVLSANASDYYALFHEKYHLLNAYQEQCLKLAERHYVKEATSFYNQLQGCLDGKVVTVTTTEKPMTTGVAAAVVVPEVTVVEVVPTEGVSLTEQQGTSVKTPLAKFMNRLK